METIHRLPVLDEDAEYQDFVEQRDEYMEAAESYGTALRWYEDAVESERREDSSEDVGLMLDRLSESYEAMQRQQSELNDFLTDYPLRMHESYMNLDEEAEQLFTERTGLKPAEATEESPQDFYFQAAGMLDQEGVEWNVETTSIDDMDQLYSQIRQSVGFIEVPVEGENIPETSPGGELIDPDVFSRLLKVHEKAGDRVLYEHVSPHEGYVFKEYDRSVLEELWGVEMGSEVIRQIENGSNDPELAD